MWLVRNLIFLAARNYFSVYFLLSFQALPRLLLLKSERSLPWRLPNRDSLIKWRNWNTNLLLGQSVTNREYPYIIDRSYPWANNCIMHDAIHSLSIYPQRTASRSSKIFNFIVYSGFAFVVIRIFLTLKISIEFFPSPDPAYLLNILWLRAFRNYYFYIFSNSFLMCFLSFFLYLFAFPDIP